MVGDGGRGGVGWGGGGGGGGDSVNEQERGTLERRDMWLETDLS